MMLGQLILAHLVITAGAFFLLIGSVGLIRLPDFYSRAHATGKSDTLGIILVTLGLVIHEGPTLNSAKILLILAFVGLTNPTATHALTRAAFRFGLKPWFRKDGAAGKEG
jgi:multicomponent Na+:H+ antiporter subunit G